MSSRVLMLVIAVVLEVAAFVRADVFETDWQRVGDGLLTRDDMSQLEWLDLSVTQGMSLTDVEDRLAPEAEYAGFSLAFIDDVISLAMSAGIDTSGISEANVAPASNLISLLGETGNRSFGFQTAAGIAIEPISGNSSTVGITHSTIGDVAGWDRSPGAVNFAEDRGVWLFRPIPTIQNGEVVTIRLTSPALEGHRPRRSARVYLPPSYNTSNRRYPVAYYLHGANGSNNEFFSSLIQGRQAADDLITNGLMQEMIIVGVDGTGGQPFSSYVNSELNGDFEDYIVQDLVEHVDNTFRTIAHRDSRAVFGASMGGYGALRYAMTHADVFGVGYSHSSGPLGFSLPGTWLYLGGDKAVFADFPNAGAVLAGVQTPSDLQDILRGLTFGWASGFSPNLDNPPMFVDLPFDLPSLDIVPEIRDTWYEHDPFELLDSHVEDLTSLRGLGLDVGDADGNLLHMEAFHQKLLEAGVPHQFEVYSGGHSDKLYKRIRISLAFLSDALLVADCNRDGVVDVFDVNCASDVGSRELAEAILEEMGSLPGDLDGDGAVLFADFLVLAANFGQFGNYTDGDIDWSGTVDFPDFLTLAENFGTSIPIASTVPEPLGFSLIGLTLILVSISQRHRCLYQ